MHWKQRKDGIVFLVFVAGAVAAVDSVEFVLVLHSYLVFGETSDTVEMVTMDVPDTHLGTKSNAPVFDTVVAGSHYAWNSDFDIHME